MAKRPIPIQKSKFQRLLAFVIVGFEEFVITKPGVGASAAQEVMCGFAAIRPVHRGGWQEELSAGHRERRAIMSRRG